MQACLWGQKKGRVHAWIAKPITSLLCTLYVRLPLPHHDTFLLRRRRQGSDGGGSASVEREGGGEVNKATSAKQKRNKGHGISRPGCLARNSKEQTACPSCLLFLLSFLTSSARVIIFVSPREERHSRASEQAGKEAGKEAKEEEDGCFHAEKACVLSWSLSMPSVQ